MRFVAWPNPARSGVKLVIRFLPALMLVDAMRCDAEWSCNCKLSRPVPISGFSLSILDETGVINFDRSRVESLLLVG